jgi:hypothetical protein
MRSPPWFALLAVLSVTGCHRHTMSATNCQRVLDRITEIELGERGFRDPVLAARRKSEMRVKFATDLEACQGRLVRMDALACIEQARNAEELSHRCLR